MNEYSAKVTCKMTGITYRQLDYWDRTDIVKPSIVSARGSGSRRRYSDQDVAVLRFLKAALDSGLRFDLLREVAAEIQQGEFVTDAFVVVCNHEFRVFRSEVELAWYIAKRVAPCWVFSLQGPCRYCQHPKHDAGDCGVLHWPDRPETHNHPNGRCLCVADQGVVPADAVGIATEHSIEDPFTGEATVEVKL